MSDSPGYALLGWAVQTLVADAALSALLFRDRPALSPEDRRVYQADAWFPKDRQSLAEILPRVVVDYIETPWGIEQDEADLMNGSVTLVVHVMADEPDRDLAEGLMNRVRDVLVSTPVTGPSIIGARLVPQSARRPVREAAFRNAWRLQQEFRSEHVGVLA